LYKSTEDITRLFSEVKDAELSRALLLVELKEQLKVPANSALAHALANIELLLKTASEAKKLPTGLAGATRTQRRHFKRSQRRYLSGAFAYQSRLEQHLPGLETFARCALNARLSEDAISPPLDIDQPFIDMPDDVHGSYCGGTSACPVGDRNIILTPSATRTTFSLLQLVLHNLDPLAPWTRWRLSRARFLQPERKPPLGADYLIRRLDQADVLPAAWHRRHAQSGAHPRVIESRVARGLCAPSALRNTRGAHNTGTTGVQHGDGGSNSAGPAEKPA
jgi:hypothetical protein